MIKISLKFLSFLIILFVLLIGYLSLVGVETKKFNNLIQEEISKSNYKIQPKFDKIKILLNLSKFSINIETLNAKLLYDDKEIKLKKISTNISIKSFLKKEFAIKNLSISTKDNSLNDAIYFVRFFKNNPQLIIFNKTVKSGSVNADIKLNFDENGKIEENYKIKGLVKAVKIRLLNKDIMSNIDLNFDIQNNLYLIKNSRIEYKRIKFLSNEIKIAKKNKYFFIEGDINNKSTNFDLEKLSFFFKKNLESLNVTNVKLSSNNNFSLKINKKLKISDYSVRSKINLDKLNYKTDFVKLKNYLPSYKGSVDFENHAIELFIKKNQLTIKGEGDYLIDKQPEKINYDISSKNGNFNFKSKINIKKIPLNIEILNYQKKENKDSTLLVEGEYKKDKTLFFTSVVLKPSCSYPKETPSIYIF